VRLLLALWGCVPAVRAGSYYANPLYEPARTTSRTPAAYRVLPPPPGCAPQAPPILLMPALGFTGDSWREVAARLGSCRARILVDTPGIGESREALEVPSEEVVSAIEDIVDAESGGRPVVLAGNSIGGMLAVRLALRRPEKVAALVLVDSPEQPYQLNRWEVTILHPWAMGPLIRLAGPYVATRLALPRSSMAGRVPDPVTVALVVRQTTDSRRRVPMKRYHDTVASSGELAVVRDNLPHLSMPALIVWGKEDQIAKPYLAEAAARALGGPVTVRILDGVGHLAPLEVPEETARILDAFLETLPATEAAPPGARRQVPGLFPPGSLIYGARREWFPVLGGAALFSTGSPTHLDLIAGVARGSIDGHYPLETGRLVWTAGVGFDAHDFRYLRTSLALELVWRWAGGFSLEGTLLVDPRSGQTDRVGGFGTLGYLPSVLPWLRAFVGYGAFPQATAGAIFGVQITARVTGWMY
jgi:pimeloyl-ACP methyl ester carboxylesterase